MNRRVMYSIDGKEWELSCHTDTGSFFTRRLNPNEEPPRYANLLLVGGVRRYPEARMIEVAEDEEGDKSNQ